MVRGELGALEKWLPLTGFLKLGIFDSVVDFSNPF